MNSRKRWRSRILIVWTGIALGYLARFVLGPPEIEKPLSREFSDPLTEIPLNELPILPVEDDFRFPVQLDIP